MTTTEQRLADALRAILPFAERDVGELAYLACDDESEDEAMDANADVERAREALAAYDAQASRLPTEYRVTTEWDSFEALTPREAASEVWEKIKRSEGPIFTVYGRDGSVTDVDLSEDDYNA